MIHRGQKVISGTMNEVKEQYANFKCTIIGKNDRSTLERIPNVTKVDQSDLVSVLHLPKDIEITSWLKELPNTIDIQELKIDRISLHEIFIHIATDQDLAQEAGDRRA